MDHLSQKNNVLFALLLLVTHTVLAQVPQDSAMLPSGNLIKKQRFQPGPVTGRSYILPAALITYGAAAAIIKANKTDLHVITSGTPAKETSPFLQPENYTALAPAAAVFGLRAAGVTGIHKPQEQALLFVMATGISSAIVYPLKNSTREVRPDKSDAHSFPSGHSSLAFASAEFLRREYGQQSTWYTVSGYTAATATAILRVAKNKHWLADVSAGAGIGIASTTTAYWIYNKLKRAPRSKNKNVILFTPAVAGGYYGICLVTLL